MYIGKVDLMEKIDNTSLNLEHKNIEILKTLFPEAVQEGKVDFNMLKTLLGSEIIGGGNITNLLGMVNINL